MKVNGVIAMLKKKSPKIVQINDILQWYENGELELSPKYQRNSVWNEKAKSYLMDTIIRGLPIPPVFMRQKIDVTTKKTYREIIDGQQRFTSLTLLLIYLNNRLKTISQSYNMIETMIFSESYGTGESVRNLYGRYLDIQDAFPEDIKDNMLLHFCDWLAEKVFFIEIAATTEQDVHKVFVTMNDRGLSLTSTEMLKGYLLSEIQSDPVREAMNSIWKDTALSLKKEDDKGDETFIKAWLRAHYADTIRETKAGAVNKDFDIIGGPFHKWVRDMRYRLVESFV